jgi:hypothetical protein
MEQATLSAECMTDSKRQEEAFRIIYIDNISHWLSDALAHNGEPERLRSCREKLEKDIAWIDAGVSCVDCLAAYERIQAQIVSWIDTLEIPDCDTQEKKFEYFRRFDELKEKSAQGIPTPEDISYLMEQQKYVKQLIDILNG